MTNGWRGTILRINLTNGNLEKERTDKYSEEFLGGKGINAKILWDEVGPDVKPLDPENRLIFGVGPVVGTLVPGSCRTSITSKSPQTGIFGDSNFGGYWGPELKAAGYDHIVIYGRSEEPVYLFVNDKSVELRSARHLWGKDTIETQRIIKDELKDLDIQVACIGPAGENEVCIAAINHDLGNSASRGGMGAVMGSKNLKAIAVRGTGDVNTARPGELAEMCTKIITTPPPPPIMGMIEELNRTAIMPGTYKTGVLSYGSHAVGPVPEFQENAVRNIAEFNDKNRARIESCYNCVTPCKHLVTVPGSGQKIVIKCENTQTIILRLKLCDYEFNVKAVDQCYRYGFDLFSIAADIAFLMDLYENGIISEKDTDGIQMKWKDGEAMLAMMGKIARREGCGELFGEGILKAAEKIGKEAEKYVYHTKGVEWIPYSHYELEHALGSAISETGCGLRSCSGTTTFLLHQFPGVIPNDLLEGLVKVNFPPDLWSAMLDERESKKRMADLLEYQERASTHIPDLLGICKFCAGWLPISMFRCEEMVKFVALVTGKDIDEEMLNRYSEKTVNLTRAYSVREGVSKKDDVVSERLFSDSSPITGKPLDRKEFDEQLDRYYHLHGWNKKGIPTRKKLEGLGLKDVADELEERKTIPKGS
jgi:aldehyde:ferredoxin oxidoreductase